MELYEPDLDIINTPGDYTNDMDIVDELERLASSPGPSVATPVQAEEGRSPSRAESSHGTPVPSGNKKPKAKPKKAKPKKTTSSKATSSKATSSKTTKSRVNQLRTAPNSIRGRSTSETAASRDTQSVEPEPEVEEEGLEEEDEEPDTKLYCVCQTYYEANRIMIQCDHCDEWYHPSCVGLQDDMLNLIDRWFCPNCSNLSTAFQTSFKPACARPTCMNVARLPFSKYCSDACGIKAVMERVDKLMQHQQDTDSDTEVVLDPFRFLEHPAVKHAHKREGVVITSPSFPSTPPRKKRKTSPSGTTLHGDGPSGDIRPLDEPNVDIHRHIARLTASLQSTTTERQGIVQSTDALEARLLLLKEAATRAEAMDHSMCGYDFRLTMDEDVWFDWLERDDGKNRERLYAFEERGVDTAEEEDETEGNWFCEDKRKCPRHAGWEALKMADFDLEIRVNKSSLSLLSSRERDLRRRIDAQQLKLLGRQAIEDAKATMIPPSNILSLAPVLATIPAPPPLLNGANSILSEAHGILEDAEEALPVPPPLSAPLDTLLDHQAIEAHEAIVRTPNIPLSALSSTIVPPLPALSEFNDNLSGADEIRHSFHDPYTFDAPMQESEPAQDGPAVKAETEDVVSLVVSVPTASEQEDTGPARVLFDGGGVTMNADGDGSPLPEVEISTDVPMMNGDSVPTAGVEGEGIGHTGTGTGIGVDPSTVLGSYGLVLGETSGRTEEEEEEEESRGIHVHEDVEGVDVDIEGGIDAAIGGSGNVLVGLMSVDGPDEGEQGDRVALVSGANAAEGEAGMNHAAQAEMNGWKAS